MPIKANRWVGWRLLLKREVLEIGDVLCEEAVYPTLVLKARHTGIARWRAMAPARGDYVAYIAVGFSGNRVEERMLAEAGAGIAINAWRRIPLLTEREKDAIEHGIVRAQDCDDDDPDEGVKFAPRIHKMHPIHSKTHPFFTRDIPKPAPPKQDVLPKKHKAFKRMANPDDVW